MNFQQTLRKRKEDLTIVKADIAKMRVRTKAEQEAEEESNMRMRTKTEEEEELSTTEATVYRRAAARLKYMTLDRADMSFASKESSRGMAKPTKGDVLRLKRTPRYLCGAKRVTNKLEWQGVQSKLRTFSDSDWAGCVKSRRSTSGGAISHGEHLLTHWSSTQTTVALSSAEAELNALVKAISESLGIKNMMSHAGVSLGVEVFTDSSAARGIVHRTSWREG